MFYVFKDLKLEYFKENKNLKKGQADLKQNKIPLPEMREILRENF